MPMPSPRNDEDRGDFIARCTNDEVMRDEFPDRRQRTAVCARIWDEDDGKSLMWTEKIEAPIELKALDEEGTFEGHAAVFGNVDLGRDVIEKGAFRKTLMAARKAGRMPKFLLQHDPRNLIGVFEDMREDSTGLMVKGRFNLEKQMAREAWSDVKIGALDGMSIGYITRRADMDERTGVRTLKEIDLMEASLVTFPMNEEARVASVKSIAHQIATVRDFETFLRDVGGFSRNAAKAIASRGFKPSDDLRDGADDAFTRGLVRLAESI